MNNNNFNKTINPKFYVSFPLSGETTDILLSTKRVDEGWNTGCIYAPYIPKCKTFLLDYIYTETNDVKIQYYKNHKLCPRCGSQNYSTTFMDYIYTVNQPYVDKNRIKCNCGWQGITDDLKPI